MKKKIVLICLLLIGCSLAIGSTLAYFASHDNANNVFEYGSIKVEQMEQEHDENGDLVDFTQNQVIYPIVNVDDPQNDPNYIEKLVSIKNKGANDAYVRCFIAVPSALKDVLHLDTDTSGKWLKDHHVWDEVTINGITHYVTSYTYNFALNKSEVSDYVLNGVYLDAKVDYQLNEANNQKQLCTLNNDGTYTFYDYDVKSGINVYVVTQACQVQGLGTNPQNAVDSAFGTETPNFN